MLTFRRLCGQVHENRADLVGAKPTGGKERDKPCYASVEGEDFLVFQLCRKAEKGSRKARATYPACICCFKKRWGRTMVAKGCVPKRQEEIGLREVDSCFAGLRVLELTFDKVELAVFEEFRPRLLKPEGHVLGYAYVA